MDRQFLWYVILNAAVDEICLAAAAARDDGNPVGEVFEMMACDLMVAIVKRRRLECN